MNVKHSKLLKKAVMLTLVGGMALLPATSHAYDNLVQGKNTIPKSTNNNQSVAIYGSGNTLKYTDFSKAVEATVSGIDNNITDTRYAHIFGNHNKVDGSDLSHGNTYITVVGDSNGYSFFNQKRAIEGSQIRILGYGNSAVGSDITVIGHDNGFTQVNNFVREIKGIDLNVLGNRNSVIANKTSVIGSDITATQNNSVILGDKSTDRAATSETEAKLENGIIFANFAGVGKEKNGIVSVGSVGGERQIINVAAGKVSADSTDAINGSQLHATNVVVGNVANSVQNLVGGDAKVNPDGTITADNIGGTGKNNINDAVQSVNDKTDKVAESLKDLIGGDTVINEDGSITNNNIGGTGANNITDAISNLNQGNQNNSQAVEDLREDTEKAIQGNTDLINKNTEAIAINKEAIETNAANIANNSNSIAALQQRTNSY